MILYNRLRRFNDVKAIADPGLRDGDWRSRRVKNAPQLAQKLLDVSREKDFLSAAW